MLGRLTKPALMAAAAAAAAPFLLGSFSSLATQAALSPDAFKPFKLQRAEQLTHDTKKYTFELKEDEELGLTAASLLVVKAEIDGKTVIRPYTPTSPVSQRGSFDLIVKSYPEGKVSKAFAALQPGDVIEAKGPFQKFAYEANAWASIGMVAGGSGITPMYQLIQTILANPRDRTELRLVYASRSEADIILKEELDALAVTHPNFKVLYTVDAPSAPGAWAGQTGHISREMLASFLPPPQAEGEAVQHKVLVCGPPGMMKHLSGEKKSPAEQGELSGLLRDMKYSPAQVFKF